LSHRGHFQTLAESLFSHVDPFRQKAVHRRRKPIAVSPAATVAPATAAPLRNTRRLIIMAVSFRSRGAPSAPLVRTGSQDSAARVQLSLGEEGGRTDDLFVLPQEIGGNKVVWLQKENDNSVVILLLALALAAGVYFAFDSDLKKQIQKRKRHLLTQYPEFVSRLVLLMGAGMTIRGAMHQMACDDERRKQESDGRYQGRGSPQDAAGDQRFSSVLDGDRKKRHSAAEDTGIGVKAGKRAAMRKGACGVRIYEEIAYTCRELDSGIPEAKAYYRLSRRCGEAHYVRLCMLLSQNLKKGTAGLLILLEQEAADAFEERKRNARRFGEEAGTRLLVPMMIMLVMVMVMIMVPAFLSFSA